MNKVYRKNGENERYKRASKKPQYNAIDFSRVILLGPRASGKTTFSSRLARHFHLIRIEFDTFNKTNGVGARDADYMRTLSEFVQSPRWVADGDYLEGVDRLALPIVWPLATTVIWLDLPFLTTMRRLVLRTHRRIFHKEVMGNNTQDKMSFLLKRLASGNAISAYWAAKRAYPIILKKPEYSHLTFVHLKTQEEVDLFLSSLPDG